MLSWNNNWIFYHVRVHASRFGSISSIRDAIRLASNEDVIEISILLPRCAEWTFRRRRAMASLDDACFFHPLNFFT